MSDKWLKTPETQNGEINYVKGCDFSQNVDKR